MAYVYSHTRLDTNEVFYIGIGSDTNGKYERANSKKGRNLYWERLVNKTNYKIEILINDISWDDACLEETRLIKQYGRKDLNEGSLVNLTNGGEGGIGMVVSEETKKKLSEFNKGKTISEETKQKMSQSQLGKKHSEESRLLMSKVQRGVPKHNEESKRKISEAGKGIKRSDEFKQKISQIVKGRILSEETKKKIGDAHRGKLVSEETRLKQSEASKGKPKGVRTIEHRLNLSKSLTGKKYPPRSDEFKQKIREYRMGKKLSEETKQKLRDVHKNRRKLQQPVPHTFF